MTTYYVVQSFQQGRRGNYLADLPVQCTGKAHAERMARRLSESKAAVVAFSRTGDVSTGEFEDAVIIAQYGSLPDYADDLAVAV